MVDHKVHCLAISPIAPDGYCSSSKGLSIRKVSTEDLSEWTICVLICIYVEIMDPRSWKPAFKILDPPSSSANLQLINDLLRHDEHRRESDVPSTWVDVCKQDLGNDGIVRGGISGGYGVSIFFPSVYLCPKKLTDVCYGKYKTSGCKLDSLPAHLDKGWEGHQKFTASLSDLLLQIRATNYDETIAIQLTTLEVRPHPTPST